MKIEIFGPGCARCQMTGKNVREVVKELVMDSETQVLEIHDLREISARGVLITPAVFIDGVKVCQGKVPSTIEIKKWLEEKR
jgi:small redox-active disulfide protein 2